MLILFLRRMRSEYLAKMKERRMKEGSADSFQGSLLSDTANPSESTQLQHPYYTALLI